MFELEEVETDQQGPCGSGGGISFKDDFTQMKKIIGFYIRSGDWIDSIGLKYEDDDGTPQLTDLHGGAGGRERTEDFDQNEYIIRIFGTYRTFVNSLCIVTNLNKTYETIPRTSGQEFNFKAPEGYQICGFHGRCGNFLDSIGVYFGKTP